MQENINQEQKISTEREYKVGDVYEIPYEGSLGLLALGHIGLKMWRDKRKQIDAEREKFKAAQPKDQTSSDNKEGKVNNNGKDTSNNQTK